MLGPKEMHATIALFEGIERRAISNDDLAPLDRAIEERLYVFLHCDPANVEVHWPRKITDRRMWRNGRIELLPVHS